MTNEEDTHNNSHFLPLIEAMSGLCDVQGLMTILVMSWTMIWPYIDISYVWLEEYMWEYCLWYMYIVGKIIGEEY